MAESSLVMFGIPNCDTIKKARRWLEQHDIDYQFHDYRKQGVDVALMQGWLDELGWEQLINKRGTTWRQLDESTKNNMDNQQALIIIQDNPAIVKRPLLLNGDHKIIGFKDSIYQQELLTE